MPSIRAKCDLRANAADIIHVSDEQDSHRAAVPPRRNTPPIGERPGQGVLNGFSQLLRRRSTTVRRMGLG